MLGFEVVFDFAIDKECSRKLVTYADPTWHPIVRPGKKLDFNSSRLHPFNNSVNFVRFSRSFSDLAHNHIAINVSVDFWIAFDSDEAVLLTVIQPMTSPTCSDYSLQLICFDPDDFLDSFIPP